MSEIRHRFTSGVLTGCLVLFGACAVDDGPQSSEQTSTTESAVLVQDCPASYGACTNWSDWEEIGPQFCNYDSNQCPFVCDPVPGRPPYCDQQIILGDECCMAFFSPETGTTVQRYRWCFDIIGNQCQELDQTSSFVGCGC